MHCNTAVGYNKNRSESETVKRKPKIKEVNRVAFQPIVGGIGE